MKMTPEVFTTLGLSASACSGVTDRRFMFQRLLFSPIRARISAWISSISIIQTLCFYQPAQCGSYKRKLGLLAEFYWPVRVELYCVREKVLSQTSVHQCKHYLRFMCADASPIRWTLLDSTCKPDLIVGHYMQACAVLLLDYLIVGHDNLLEFCPHCGAIAGFLR